jgi:Protein of unknown function (DUF3467)
MTSQWDIQFMFNHVQPAIGSSTGTAVYQKALVTMSLSHAKAMAIALAKHIKEWETKFGEIKLQEQP